MDVNDLFKPKDLSYYQNLTAGGDYQVSLNQQQASIILKIHDYGIDALNQDDVQHLYSAVGQLKDCIHP